MSGARRPSYAIEVRQAVAQDLPAVHRIVTAAYAEFEPWLTPENWGRMTGNIARVVEPGAPGRLRVAELGGRIAGTVTYLPPGPKDYSGSRPSGRSSGCWGWTLGCADAG
ncbi:MAG TPA: hypothetical protein VGL88_08635, partial [Pseudonocardiaceae bacterium]